MVTGKHPPVELNERSVQNALFAIGQPENWGELVKVGTAVKAAIGENGRAMFVEWAENSHWGASNPQRKARHNFSKNYDGFNTQAVGAATLIYLANERTGGEFSRQNAKGDFQQSPEYLARQAARRQEIDAQQAAAERAREEKNTQTVQEIQQWFAPTALPAKVTHPYLRRKGFTDVPKGITYYANRIQIPLSDKDGNIIAAQKIHGNPPDGMPQKQVYAAYKGASFTIGDITQADKGVIMAEGLATAYSLHKATGLPAIMAVSSANFDDVAAVFKEKLPSGIPFIIAADNDQNQAGIKAAQQAAKVYGKDAVIQMVEFDAATRAKFQQRNGGNEPTDFNDLALYGSLAAVKQQIDKAIEAHSRQNIETTPIQPTTLQQEKNSMDAHLNPDNLADTRNMSEKDFRQALDAAIQNGSLNESIARLNERFETDFLDNNPARLSSSYEMSQRIKNSLPENEQTQTALKILAEMDSRMNTADDAITLEIAARSELLAKQWQPESEPPIETVQEGTKQAHTEPSQAQVIETPAAVHIAPTEATASEKEDDLKHFRENLGQIQKNNEQQAQASEGFLEEMQHLSFSVDNHEPPEMPPPPSDEELMQSMQDINQQNENPEPVAPIHSEKGVDTVATTTSPNLNVTEKEQNDEPTVNADGTNSVEQTPKRIQAEKAEPPEPQEMTAREYQERVYHAYLDGTLQKDLEKLADKMGKAKTPETFRDHYTEFSRMRNAIMEVDANDNLKAELGNPNEGSLKEQDGVKWARLTAAIGAGTQIAYEKAETDAIFQAAFEDGQRYAQRFKQDNSLPREQPELETITAEEALRNLNRTQTAHDNAPLPSPENKQPLETEPQENAKKSTAEPKPEKPLSVEQPQIKLPREVTDHYLVNKDKTELYDERTGETRIYINSEKNQLKTKHQDFDTVEAMIKIAEKNQWSSITVKGTAEFRKLAWEMASIQGIEVKGYKPTKQEMAVMEARKARLDELKATNRIEGTTQVKQQTDLKQQSDFKQQPDFKQRPDFRKPEINDNSNARHVRGNTDLPAIYYETQNNHFGAGIVVNFGSEVHPDFKDKPHAKQIPFIELETVHGTRHTVRGTMLKNLIDQHNIQFGDRVALRVERSEEFIKNGVKRSINIWEIKDLVQQKRENQTQTQHAQQEQQHNQSARKPSLTGAFVAAAQEMIRRGETVTAYKPIEQTPIQPKPQSETQNIKANQEQKPRRVSQ